MQCVGKNGVVHRITDRGDIRVQYEGSTSRWTIHPGALTKVPELSHRSVLKPQFIIASLLLACIFKSIFF